MAGAWHLLLGVVAALLAALRFLTWTSLGLSIGAGRLRTRDGIRATVAVLAGACLTMLVYEVLSASGQLAAAVVVDAAIAVSAMLSRGREAVSLLRDAFHRVVPARRSGRVVLGAVAVLFWLVAIGPPRDGDVMHYHLAHIRQIIAFGVWRQLPICSYGIPFGWSLTYLPFEWAGIPQVAHLVNSGTWLLTCAMCVESTEQSSGESDGRSVNVTRWVLLAVTLVPIIMKATTTAMADAVMIMVVALNLALLLEWPMLGRAETAALGFAAFAGLTTRYQAAAVAAATSLIVAMHMLRRRETRGLAGPFAIGALAAVVAAAPFYIANQVTLGSPVWPFGSSLVHWSGAALGGGRADLARAADTCASRAVAGGWKEIPGALARLLSARTVFPIPFVLSCATLAVLAAGPSRLRRVAAFILVFLAAWCWAQPTLEPRFSIYLTAGAVICAVPTISRLLASRFALALRVVGGIVLGAEAMISLLYARDYLRLPVTGDIARFHHATWYWPAYDWANRNTPDSARFVVVLYGGATYPLHRWNVSADPGSSAVLPWASVTTVCDFAAFLRAERASFVFYGPNVWTGRAMSDEIAGTIAGATSAGVLDSVKVFDVPIVYGRMEGLERRTNVVLFRVDQTAARSVCDSKHSSGARGGLE